MSTIKIINIQFSSVEDWRQFYEKVKNNKTIYKTHFLKKEDTTYMILETAKKQNKKFACVIRIIIVCYFLMCR